MASAVTKQIRQRPPVHPRPASGAVKGGPKYSSSMIIFQRVQRVQDRGGRGRKSRGRRGHCCFFLKEISKLDTKVDPLKKKVFRKTSFLNVSEQNKFSFFCDIFVLFFRNLQKEVILTLEVLVDLSDVCSQIWYQPHHTVVLEMLGYHYDGVGYH